MKPLAVYLHFPFCERRCGYCDFVSCCDLALIDAYLDKLCAEIKVFDFTPYRVKTIYLGGGTPSLLRPEQLQRVLACLPLGAGEITIEVNPNSLTEAKCRAYRALGINRISIGVQSFADATLKSLGRLHDVATAVRAIETAHKYFSNISIDLIKDIPGHPFVPPPDKVLNLVQHISIYSLTKNDTPVAETDEAVHLPAAFQRYEVSNYARRGYESRHNLTYWQGGDYIGFGAGAHSYLTGVRSYNTADILDYTHQVEPPRTADQIRDEKIMLGLRLATGVDLDLLAGKDDAIAWLVAQGLVRLQKKHLCATAKGFRFLNQIWLRLV